jgi:IS5 family transposase
MHKKYEKQLPLTESTPDHPKAKEWEQIGKILDQHPAIYDQVLKDITSAVKNKEAGANGMTAEQVTRSAIIKRVERYSYEALSFHLVDSRCYRKFCRIGIGHKGFKKSALCQNIKAISPETWEEINEVVVDYAEDEGIEKGRKVRTDCTVVLSDIHKPTDSSLLYDSVRVLARNLARAKEELPGLKFPFQDHTKRAKRRGLGVLNAKGEKARNKEYRDLLKVTRRTIRYAQAAIFELKVYTGGEVMQMLLAQGCCQELEQYVGLALQVVDQTERRVVKGEVVPASEKVFSIFEPHTDIIIKDRRDKFYGHKICLTGGASGLILDCLILEGNPADSTLSDKMLDRQKDIYGRYPLKVSLDGGFASKANLKSAKGKGIKDVCFSKGKGLKEEDMCRSNYVYKMMRKFRAGIESSISWLKRSFELWRCLWKGLTSFKSYVWSAIVSANLLTIARKQLA